MLLAALLTPNVDIIDSRDDNKYTYVVLDECVVPVLKTKIGDTCYVFKLVENKCHVEFLNKKECKGK